MTFEQSSNKVITSWQSLLEEYYVTLGFSVDLMRLESQNEEYEGRCFVLEGKSVRYRTAKTTPKKVGQFVAIWKKNAENKNEAFKAEESPDYLIITVYDHYQWGQFIFPKEVLIKQKIYQTVNNKGKMAMRLYPDWVTELNPTAKKTQAWQKEYFINLTAGINSDKIKEKFPR